MAIPYSRQRALLAALLLFSIFSLLITSLHPSFSIDQEQNWIPSRRKPWLPDPEEKTSDLSSPPTAESADLDEPATGNTARLGPDLDVSSLPSVNWLKDQLRGTVLDSTRLGEDLENPLRPVRGKAAAEQSRLRLEESEAGNNHSDDDDEDEDEELEESGNEEPRVPDDSKISDPSDKAPQVSQETLAEQNSEQSSKTDPNDTTTGLDDDEETEEDDEELDEEAKAQREKEVMEQAQVDDELAGDEEVEVTDDQPDGDETAEDGGDMHDTEEDDGDNDDGQEEEEEEEEQVSRDRSLADLDLNNVLSTDESYMLFVPSGDTIEQQFNSLVTALWMARHANRTLLVPPPIMPSPTLQSWVAPDYVPQKSRLVWGSYYELGRITNVQRIRFVDSVRQRLPLAFTDAMLREEADPTTPYQTVPKQVQELSLTWTSSIQCHGPPTAGSWKTLDFAGRHFLNSYGLQPQFQVLGDRYWDLSPEAIHKHWRYIPTPTVPISSAQTQGEDRDRDHHQQLICVSGADLVGLNDPAMEEQIWQEVGAQVRFSKTTNAKALAGIQRALRGLEKADRKFGYIGVHFDKMPPKEVCYPSSTSPSSSEENSAGSSSSTSSSLLPLAGATSIQVQCDWTVDLVSKRIAMLQQEAGKPRPVVVTTTETDPEILLKMDLQPGWTRVEHGVDDDGGAAGLFDPLGVGETAATSVVSGGYAHQIARAKIHSTAAIFVGRRDSPFDVHVAFRLKNEGRLKIVPPRWELY